MTFAVMLAQSMPATDSTMKMLVDSDEWLFSLKIDGVRATILVNDGRVTIVNRSQNNITAQFPDVVQDVLDTFGNKARLILDGEICVTTNGFPDFPRTAKRNKQTKSAIIKALSETMPAQFYCFDLLYQDGQDMRQHPFSERWEAVTNLLNGKPKIVQVVTSEDGHAMMKFVRTHSLEGLVAKRKDSVYRAGRQATWVKIKPTQTATCIVTGHSVGNGARSDTFGALDLAVLDAQGDLLSVGQVGTGFKARDLAEVKSLLGSEFYVEVEFMEYTEKGSLRFPVYKHIRQDVTRSDCTLAQFA